jgi:hypothetical protein
MTGVLPTTRSFCHPGIVTGMLTMTTGTVSMAGKTRPTTVTNTVGSIRSTTRKGMVTMATNTTGTTIATIIGTTVVPVFDSITTTAPPPWSISYCRVLSY